MDLQAQVLLAAVSSKHWEKAEIVFCELVFVSVHGSDLDSRQRQQSRRCDHPSMDGAAVPVADLT